MNQQLQDLEKDQERNTLAEGNALLTYDLLPTHRHLFNEATLRVLDKPLSHTQVKQRPGSMDCDICQYFVIRVIGKYNIPKAVEKLADALNYHSSLGHIDSYLTPLSYVALANVGFEPQTESNTDYLVYSFPLFTPEGLEAVDDAKYDFRMIEGTVPPVESAIGYAPSVLLPGIAHYFVSVACGLLMVKDFNLEGFILEHKKLLTSILPRGTEITAVDERNSIMGLSKDYRFTLKHPWFKPGMTVEIEECRIVWEENGTIKVDRILTGVRFLNADGTNQLD